MKKKIKTAILLTPVSLAAAFFACDYSDDKYGTGQPDKDEMYHDAERDNTETDESDVYRDTNYFDTLHRDTI